MMGVSGDAIQPGIEMTVIAKRIAILQDSVEDILNEILTGGAFSRHPEEKLVERKMVPFEQDFQFGSRPFAYCSHQSFISGIHSHDHPESLFSAYPIRRISVTRDYKSGIGAGQPAPVPGNGWTD
jgi:hypothetical protein